METVLNMVIDPDNVRMLLMVVLGWSGFVLLKSQMKEMGHSLNKRIDGVEASLNKKIDGVEVSLNKKIDSVEASLNKRIDGVEASIKELKYNDFAHLNNSVEALTYALEKNGSLKKEDKEFIDSRLAR